MEPEDSLPSSQEPPTGPYSEPDQSNPYYPILSHTSDMSSASKHLRVDDGGQ
jgi:hypothetical protein